MSRDGEDSLVGEMSPARNSRSPKLSSGISKVRFWKLSVEEVIFGCFDLLFCLNSDFLEIQADLYLAEQVK